MLKTLSKTFPETSQSNFSQIIIAHSSLFISHFSFTSTGWLGLEVYSYSYMGVPVGVWGGGRVERQILKILHNQSSSFLHIQVGKSEIH